MRFITQHSIPLAYIIQTLCCGARFFPISSGTASNRWLLCHIPHIIQLYTGLEYNSLNFPHTRPIKSPQQSPHQHYTPENALCALILHALERSKTRREMRRVQFVELTIYKRHLRVCGTKRRICHVFEAFLRPLCFFYWPRCLRRFPTIHQHVLAVMHG